MLCVIICYIVLLGLILYNCEQVSTCSTSNIQLIQILNLQCKTTEDVSPEYVNSCQAEIHLVYTECCLTKDLGAHKPTDELNGLRCRTNLKKSGHQCRSSNRNMRRSAIRKKRTAPNPLISLKSGEEKGYLMCK